MCQAMSMLKVPAPSRASPLPQCSWMYAESVNGPNFCGSWLASDGGVSGGIDAEGAGP
ncbi:hypothetical protein ACVWYU_004725, partial [Pseudomonas sp. TE12234]